MAQDNSTNGIFSMTTIVRTACLASAVTLLSFPLQAKEPGHAKAAVVTPVLKTDKTITGGKLTLPQGDVEVAVSQYEIAPGATLPIHKHPYPRYAYVFPANCASPTKIRGKARPSRLETSSLNLSINGTAARISVQSRSSCSSSIRSGRARITS